MIVAALRSAGRRAGTTARSRNFTASSAKAGGHGGPAYEHAEHKYDIGSMSNKGLKFVLHVSSCIIAQNTLSPTPLCPNPRFGLGIFGGLALGCAIPVIAVKFQQKKAQG